MTKMQKTFKIYKCMWKKLEPIKISFFESMLHDIYFKVGWNVKF